MLKVILFDIDNTLLSFDGYVEEAMRSGFREFGIGPYEDSKPGVFAPASTTPKERAFRAV